MAKVTNRDQGPGGRRTLGVVAAMAGLAVALIAASHILVDASPALAVGASAAAATALMGASLVIQRVCSRKDPS